MTRWRRPITAALVPAAALLSFALGEGGPGPLARAAAAVAEPIQAAVAAAGPGAFLGGIFSGGRLARENAALRRENAALRREVQESRERVATAQRLERLLGFRERSGFAVTAARVIGRDASGLYRTVLVDRGAADGVRPNQGVLAPDGVVGRTVKVFPRSSLVLLVTDRSSGIDALVQRTRDRGVVQGLGADRCALRFLSRQAEVETGDYVATSGLGGQFPKGIWIGRIGRVERGGDVFQSVEILPAAALERLEEVWILAGQEAPR